MRVYFKYNRYIFYTEWAAVYPDIFQGSFFVNKLLPLFIARPVEQS